MRKGNIIALEIKNLFAHRKKKNIPSQGELTPKSTKTNPKIGGKEKGIGR